MLMWPHARPLFAPTPNPTPTLPFVYTAKLNVHIIYVFSSTQFIFIGAISLFNSMHISHLPLS